MKRLLFCTLTLVLMLFALASCFGENHEYSGPCDPSCNECNRVTREPEIAHTFADCNDTECDVCGEVREAVAHSFKSACSAKCEACDFERTDIQAHIYDSPCDTDCNVCGETREASDHIYSNDCDTDCNFCGALRVTTHIYSNACDKTCNVCSALRIPAAHVYSNACDSTCDVCGELRMVPNHVYTTACDADCNVCGELRIAANHTYDHACDADCNVCGAVHVVADHVYDNACDADCNTCGTVRENIHDFTDWKTKTPANCDTAEVIARSCGLCGTEETIDGEPALDHVFDNDCDIACNRAKCDYRRATNHTYTTEFVTKLPATCTTTERLHRFCDICGTEEIKAGEPASGHAYENDCDADCNNDGCDFVRVIEEDDHKFNDWAIQTPADCYDPEILFRVCETCGGVETKIGAPVLEHVFDNACDTDCNYECGYSRSIQHAFDEWTTLTPATCTDAEIEEQICGICGAHNPETRIGDPAMDHAFDNDCDTDCNRAECDFTREITHPFGEWTTLTPATCTDAEVEIRICTCGHSETRNGDPALDHEYDNACDAVCNRKDCGFVREVGDHIPSQADCTVCSECGATIEGAAHVATDSDCTVCKNCDAGTGKNHVANPANCVLCQNCRQASGVSHTPNYAENCTQCEVCKKNLGTAHSDANGDGKCDKCPTEVIPGENWFPWAPL